MKKILVPAIALALPAMAMAQSSVDAYALSQGELRGTARFMSMGGAFTALGGDLSAITLNPASIGVYRSSEIGATLDINMRHYNTDVSKQSQTKAFCNNFGYVGVVKLDGALRTFSWGASYARTASFDRIVSGYNYPTHTSLSNYVAALTNGVGVPSSEMDFVKDKYDPYIDSSNDWLSILAYNSYLINPINAAGDEYAGLYQNGTDGDATYDLRERGYIDEYNISFGGNVSDVVYWGMNIGITDLSYSRDVLYTESMANAYIPDASGRFVNGNAGCELANSQYISGNGWNLNFGVILKPVNEFRIGFSIKTPTWWSLQHGSVGTLNSRRTPDGSTQPITASEYTDDASYDSRLASPWKMNVGVAGVIGSSAILSLDYEYTAFPDMKVKHQTGYYGNNFVEATAVNDDINAYFRGANTLRIGAEYRVTPQFSIRAGYAWQSSNLKEETENGELEIYTSGISTDPSYVFNKTSNQVSVGLGYRYKGWYIDAAYVYKKRDSQYHAYTNWNGNIAPSGAINEHFNSIVLSTGFKF